MTSLTLALSAIFAGGLVACASGGGDNSSSKEKSENARDRETTTATPDSSEADGSRVLSNHPCPKNSHVVNGKCVLNVETTE